MLQGHTLWEVTLGPPLERGDAGTGVSTVWHRLQWEMEVSPEGKALAPPGPGPDS